MRSALLRRSVPPVPSHLRVGVVTSSSGAQRCYARCSSYGDLAGIGDFAVDMRKAESPYTTIHVWGSENHEQDG